MATNLEIQLAMRSSDLKSAETGFKAIGTSAEDAGKKVKQLDDGTVKGAAEVRKAYILAAAEVGRLGTAVAANSKTAEQNLLKATLRVRDLEREFADARKSGGPIPPGLEQDIARMNAAIEANTQKLGANRAAQESARRALGDATREAGGLGGGISSVSNIVGLFSNKLEASALQLGVWVGGAAVAGRAVDDLGSRVHALLEEFDAAPGKIAKSDALFKGMANYFKPGGALIQGMRTMLAWRDKILDAPSTDLILTGDDRKQRETIRNAAALEKQIEAINKQGEKSHRIVTEMTRRWGAQVKTWGDADRRAKELEDSIERLNKDFPVAQPIWQINPDIQRQVLEILRAAEIRIPLMLEISPAQTDRIREQLRRQFAQKESMTAWAEALRTGFRGADEEIQRVALHLADVIDGVQKIRDGGKQVAEGWAQVAVSIAGIAESLGLMDQNKTPGGFGGKGEGNYAQEGAAIGAIIGGIIGAFMGGQVQAGMAIGGAAGSMLGSFIKKGADESLATIKLDSANIVAVITKNEGSLGSVIREVALSINEAVKSLLDLLGASIDSLPQMSMKVRDGIISVWVGAVNARVKSMDEAISFAVTEILKQSETTGLSDVMRKILEGTRATDVGELGRDLEFGQWYERLGLEDIETGILDALILFRSNMRRATEFGLDLEPVVADFARQLQNMRDQVLGIQLNPQERLRRDVAAFNQQVTLLRAEQETKQADLAFRRADLVARIAMMRAETGMRGAQLGFDKTFIATEADLIDASLKMGYAYLNVRGEMVRAEGGLVSAEFQMLGALLDALAAVDRAMVVAAGILDSLPALISDAELGDAMKRLGAGGGGGRKSGERDTMRRALDDIDKQFSMRGMGEWAKKFAELQAKYADWRPLAKNAEELERIVKAREKEITLLRDQVNEKYSKYLDGFGQGAFGLDVQKFIDDLSDIPRQVLPNWKKELIKERFLEEKLGEVEGGIRDFGGEGFFPTAEIDAVRGRAEELRKSLEALAAEGVDVTAQLELLAAAEQFRLEQIGTGLLDKLYGYLKDDKRFEAQYREFQKKKVDLEFRLIEAQLKALGMWDDETKALFDAARKAAGDIADAARQGVTGQDVQRLFAERRQQEAEEAARKAEEIRQRALETIARLMELRRSLIVNERTSPLRTVDRYQEAFRQFNELASQVGGGAYDRFNELASLAQTVLGLGQETTAGEGYRDIFRQVNALLLATEGAIRAGGGTTATDAATLAREGIAATREGTAQQIARLEQLIAAQERQLAELRALRQAITIDPLAGVA